MSDPLVSVVIAAYNSERFLAAAIESVLIQDYSPFELIVVDDGSTDSTASIAARYPQAAYIRQENQGNGSTKTTGLAAASGDLIAFLDGDDSWLPDKLKVQARYLLQNPEIDFVICHAVNVLEPGSQWPAHIVPDHRGPSVPSYMPSAMMMRRSAFDRVGPFDARLRLVNDFDWIIRSRDAGLKCALLPETLLHHRFHDANLSHQIGQVKRESLRALHGSIKRKRAGHNGGSSGAG